MCVASCLYICSGFSLVLFWFYLGDLFPVFVFGYVLFIVGLLIPVIYECLVFWFDNLLTIQ